MNFEYEDLLDEHACIASATECTGLIAALPEDMQKTENQTEMYAVHHAPPEKEGEKWRGERKQEQKNPRS